MRALRAFCLRLFSLILLAGALPFTACQTPADHLQTDITRPPVELSAAIDKSTAEIGDTLTYTLELDHVGGLEVTIPDVGLALQGLAIKDITETEPKERDGRQVQSRIYQLRADQSGSYRIPGVTLRYEDEAGAEIQVAAPPLFIEVLSSEAPEGELPTLADIKPIVRPPVDHSKYGIAALVVLILGLLLFLAKKWSERRAPLKTVIPPKPAWVLAQQEWDALMAANYLSADHHRKHFFEMSEIFRRYIERRFQVAALELTTEELLRHFRWGGPLSQAMPQEAEDIARRFFNGADRIKYAKYAPDRDEGEKLSQDCKKFIQLTIPRLPLVTDEEVQA